MNAPEVSVIIPYYEGEKWLPLSISSVLKQKGISWELTVVDDGSTTSPEKTIASFKDERLRLVRVDHGGKGAAINEGTRQSRSSVIVILDQDDLMKEDRLLNQLKALRENPDVEAVYSDYECATEDGRLLETRVCRQAGPRELLHEMMTGRSLISMQTLMIRKSRLVRLGGFSSDISIMGLDDGEFFARLICSGTKVLYVPIIATRYIFHDGNYSKSRKFQDARISYLRNMKELCEICPLLARELKYCRYHNHLMRGMYFLEHGEPSSALPELMSAVAAYPLHLAAYYLFVKAGILSLQHGKGK